MIVSRSPSHLPSLKTTSRELPRIRRGVKPQQAAVGHLLCPSDSRAAGVSQGGNYTALGKRFGLTSYLAVEGSAYERGPDPSQLDLQLGGPKDGVLYRSSDTRLTDITDGTSN